MEDLFTRYWDDTPVQLKAPPIEIRELKKPLPLPSGIPIKDFSVTQTFVNPERNSRLVPSLGSIKAVREMLREKWHSDIPEYLRPSTLLFAGDRILLHGTSEWHLFDRNGSSVKTGILRSGGVMLDQERSLFYAENQFSLIAACRLDNGRQAFSLVLYHKDNFNRKLLARFGRLFVTLSTQFEIDAAISPPEYSIVEITDLGDPKVFKSWEDEGGPSVVRDIIRKTSWLLAALHENTIVLTTHDRVYLLDLDLEIRQAMTGKFTPADLSLDEGGRIYLVVESEGRNELWLLTPKGERAYSFILPPGIAGVAGPPIVGYDHTVYLNTGQYLFAIAMDGKLKWSRPAAGRIAGAAVTADGQLLVSEGSEIAAYNSKGDRQRLHLFPGEQLNTPPILTPENEILVASGARLYCLMLPKN